jgi:hypothetical protein
MDEEKEREKGEHPDASLIPEHGHQKHYEQSVSYEAGRVLCGVLGIDTQCRKPRPISARLDAPERRSKRSGEAGRDDASNQEKHRARPQRTKREG